MGTRSTPTGLCGGAQFKQIELTCPPRADWLARSCSRSAGQRATSRIVREARSRACSRCPAPATAIRSSAGSTVKNDIAESESLLFGSGFGVGTDIETGPNGNLFVVPLSQGVVYEIFRR
jgi:hypothetical protein